MILLAALHLMGKHAFNFNLYESVVEAERRQLGLPGVSRGALLRRVETFPANLAFRERDWLGRELEGRSSRRRAWVKLRRGFVVRLRAMEIWAWLLGLLALADLGVLFGAVRSLLW